MNLSICGSPGDEGIQRPPLSAGWWPWKHWQLCNGSSPPPKAGVIGKSFLTQLIGNLLTSTSLSALPSWGGALLSVLTPRSAGRHSVLLYNGILSLLLGMEVIQPQNTLPSRKGFHLRAAFVSAGKAPSAFLNWSCHWGCCRLVEAGGPEVSVKAGASATRPSKVWTIFFFIPFYKFLDAPMPSYNNYHFETCPNIFSYYLHFLWLSLWTRHKFKAKCFTVSTCALNTQWSATYYHLRQKTLSLSHMIF